MKELNTIKQTAQVSKIILGSEVGGGGKGNDDAFFVKLERTYYIY